MMIKLPLSFGKRHTYLFFLGMRSHLYPKQREWEMVLLVLDAKIDSYVSACKGTWSCVAYTGSCACWNPPFHRVNGGIGALCSFVFGHTPIQQVPWRYKALEGSTSILCLETDWESVRLFKLQRKKLPMPSQYPSSCVFGLTKLSGHCSKIASPPTHCSSLIWSLTGHG